MKRPRHLLLWAGLMGVLIIFSIAAFRAGETQLLFAFAAGFLAAFLLYIFYPLSSDPEVRLPETHTAPGPAVLENGERAIFIPGRNLEEMLQRLGSDESMLNVILNSMGEGVVLLNQADRVVLMNPSAEKILGTAEKDGMGKHYLEVVRHPVLSDLLAKAKAQGDLASGEIEFSSKDERTFAVSVAALRVERGHWLGQIMVFSDITSLKKLMRMRTDFAANVSHELKTPLTAILGYVETLLEGAIDDKKNRVQFLEKISAQAQRLHALIADVLQLSAIESGAYLEAVEAVDLSEVAQQAVELLKAKREARGIQVLQEIPAGRMALTPKEGIFHVVENLLDNAIKYSPAKSKVFIRSRILEDGRVELSVEDEGPGIPAEARGRIFERFFRVDASRSREAGGTGLGLSIVKHLVDRMEGEIHLISEVGKGSTFRIILPAPQAPSPG
jgi:two-component system phosphate regulon sensor histidine kinase PhoR